MKVSLRIAAIVCLLVVAGVHLHLYQVSYHFIPTIGPLFVAAGVIAVLAAIGLMVRPSKLLNLAGALFCLGTFVSYILALVLPAGIFGFHEPYLISGSNVAYEGIVVIVAEVVGAVVMLVGAKQSDQLL